MQAAGARVGFAEGAARVTVRAAPSFGAVVERLLRVTRGPVSALSVVLTLWPVTLIATLIVAIFGGGWALALTRWVLGAVFVGLALRRFGPPGALRMALVYEPMAIALALAGILRKARGKSLTWGGETYD